MRLYSIVTNKESKEKRIIKGEYNTKKAFMLDLKGNGYTCSKIYTLEQFFALEHVLYKKDVFNKEILNQILEFHQDEFKYFCSIEK